MKLLGLRLPRRCAPGNDNSGGCVKVLGCFCYCRKKGDRFNLPLAERNQSLFFPAFAIIGWDDKKGRFIVIDESEIATSLRSSQ